MDNFLIYDIEANGLFDDYEKQNATHIWCICLLDKDKYEYIFIKDDLLEESSFVSRKGRVVKSLSEFSPWILDYFLRKKAKALICHNQLDYDLRMLNKFCGLEYSIKPDKWLHFGGIDLEFIDTLLDSKWLNPKRMLPWGCPASIKPADGGKSKIIGPHGLESWGYRVSKKKPAIEDWENLHIDEYVNRCLEDIHINYGTFEMLNSEIAKYFKGVDSLRYWSHNRKKAKLPIWIEHGFKQDIIEQRTNGVPFNKKFAEEFYPKLDTELEELRKEIESHLPHIPIPLSRLADWKFPARPFKQDKKLGAVPSSALIKFCNKWGGKEPWKEGADWWIEITVEGETKKYKAPFPDFIKTTEQMTVESEHLPQYIIDTYGWKPMYWNYKLDPKSKKKLRDDKNNLIPTTPRFKDAATGRLCPHLASLEVSFIKKVLRYRTIKHRRQTIKSFTNDVKGYLNHPRLEIDGRLPADMDTIGAACFTADTLILTEKGQDYWFNIEVGERVATHEGRLMPVIDKFVNGYKEVFEVELDNGIKTKVTGNHPFLTNFGWLECEKLIPGKVQVMAYPTKEEWGQWKDEPLLVSTWGRVKSLKSGKLYKTRCCDKRSGRRGVDVGLKDGTFRTLRVARMMVETFFKNFQEDLHCLHRNDLAFDEYIGNLYLGTQQDNARDRAKYGRCSEGGRKKWKLSEKDVEDILESTLSSTKIAEKYNVSSGYIREIRRREKRLLLAYEEKVFSPRYVPVKSVTPLGKQWTYALTVEEDHSHLTDGILTHNTSRVTHRVVANVPKAEDDVLYGKEMRACFYAGEDPDWFFIGWDASGLEARLEGSEAAKYDGGHYATILMETDIHQSNADKFEIVRGQAKGIKYGLGYGAGIKKIAQMLDVPERRAKEIIEDWWDEYWSVKKVIDALEKEWKRNKKKFIRGIDGRPIMMASAHTALNYRLQNAGTVVMKLSACLLRSEPKVVKWKKEGKVMKVVDYHDEAQWLVHKSLVKFKKVASKEEGQKYFLTKNTTKPFKKGNQWWVAYCELGKLGCNAIYEAGKKLGLKVDLAGDYQIGKSWADTH